MPLSARNAAGAEYLALITELLQRARVASPTGGLWEAADFQWWWRRDQHPFSKRQQFWLERSTPVAAIVITDWDGRYSCDLVADHHDLASRGGLLWSTVVHLVDDVGPCPIEIVVRDDESFLEPLLSLAGFEPTGQTGGTTWMHASDRPPVTPLPPGYALTDRTTRRGPHHLARRSGEDVEELLRACSLYSPGLDLAVVDGAGEVVAYGLFWADPVTGVGLVEPMRTEEAHRQKGLARSVLTEGLARLEGGGCDRFKVSFEHSNAAAKSTYLGAGFRLVSTTRTWQRRPSTT